MVNFLFLMLFLLPVFLSFYYGGWITGLLFIALLIGLFKMGLSLIDS